MQEDNSLVFAERMCQSNSLMTVQEYGKIYIYKRGCYVPVKSSKCDAEIHKIITEQPEGRCLTPAKRDNVIRNIEMFTSVKEDEVNPEGIFNFLDGLYDIRSNSLAEHNPIYKVTIQLPYRYRECVDAPIWESFIKSVTENDQEKINLLQEFCGYCLMKSCRFEKALFLIGRGSNGKSVFSETIGKVFGKQNVSSVSLEGLSNPVLRCNIINKYINIDSDLPRNALDFEEAFRKITTGEPIQFNEKFVPSFTQSTFCKLIYCLNEFPSIDDTSNAFYRRMILIPFNVEYSNDDKDVNLKQKLESELAGIFRWCVQGYRRIEKQGFSKNRFMDEIIKNLKIDNNPIMAFVSEEVNLNSPTKGITKKGLYRQFVQWAKDHGHRPMAYRKFNNRFYSEYKKYTSNDAQSTIDERARFWPNLAYINRENYFENGEITQSFSD